MSKRVDVEQIDRHIDAVPDEVLVGVVVVRYEETVYLQKEVVFFVLLILVVFARINHIQYVASLVGNELF